MEPPKPPFRKLRGYAFDPALSQQADTADFNSIVYKVPWEDLKANPEDAPYQQGPGPVGEYIEVIDFDPTTKNFYRAVDLNAPYILAQDGLSPSESNPLFHQQMVYAVTMTTIRNFERALGRKVMWSPRRKADSQEQLFVKRLRVYPHALREANAFYSPFKKALLFGYFSASPADESLQMPGSLVFTCLSHDIIAHETTHAILDGMHRHYNIPSNPDVLAFHEAFADIVALFQHFSFPDVLKRQIADTRGDLAAQNLLGKLAQQFGTAIGHYGSLRDAIGETDKLTGEWKPKKPSADDYKKEIEPHSRGSILVAAIFEAFINIYKKQVADLLRIASNGTGILPQGELHPDLVNRLSVEAAKISGHVLQMCIRALDYCPPVDITFGDFLRAVITADKDLIAEDTRNYRLFFIDSFRRRGIFPSGVNNLSVDSLCYQPVQVMKDKMSEPFQKIGDVLREYIKEIMYENDREQIFEITKKYMGGNNHSLHARLSTKFEASEEFERLTGIVFTPGWEKLGIRSSTAYSPSTPSFQVQNLRNISRSGPDGTHLNHIIFSIIQRSGVITDKDGNFTEHYQRSEGNPPPSGGFELWGGCTFIFDLDQNKLKYVISKPLFDTDSWSAENKQIDRSRIESVHNFRISQLLGMSDYNAYFGNNPEDIGAEPFAILHNH